MKKQVKFRKSRVFNSINIILIALLLVEIILVGNWIATGNPVRGITSEAKPVNIATTTLNSLGTLVTKEGTVELMIVDNFEKPELSKEVYYLNENGKRYLLSTDTPLPVSAKIKVTGYLKDNTLSFSNSPTKASALQGTSYTYTSSDLLPPWPKTLGEQRYIVIYLVNETEMDTFNETNFTTITFGLAKDWIHEASYGKASLNMPPSYKFIFNESLCDPQDIFEDAVKKADPFVNFNDYDGVIVYHPEKGVDCTPYGGLATYGKVSIFEDGPKLFKIWHNGYDRVNYYRGILHEMGHNFGLSHASGLFCGNFPNRKPLDYLCYHDEYIDHFDLMGNVVPAEQYGLRNKVDVLGWIEEENVPEVEMGIYFIQSIKENPNTFSEFQGIKVPINWDTTSKVMLQNPYNPEEIWPIAKFSFAPLTHYYLEYRNFDSKIAETFLDYEDERTYGLNISKINSGVIIKLGRSRLFWDDGSNQISFTNTWSVQMHPNAEICFDSGECSDHWYYSSIFAYLLENETYSDSFNKMNITVLDMNESGALVKITRWPTCTETDGGYSVYTKGTVNATNSSGTYSYTDYCVSSSYVKEYYCQNNQALSTNAYCSKGCLNYNGACTRPTSTGCYIDPKTKKKVCPGTPVA